MRPFDRDGLSNAAESSDVILVEPYNEGTSAAEVTDALTDRPIRLLSIGVRNREHRRYGTRHHHTRAHGLDEASIRKRIEAFINQN